jgi:capsular exopolysaccharide synthesis family protein
MAVVLLKDRTQDSIVDPGYAQLSLNLPELGAIPSARLESPERKLRFANLLRRAATEPGAMEQSLRVWNGGSSLAADSVRGIATSILAGCRGERPGAMVVTSVAPGEGKTTVATNLAVAFAAMNLNVLLIDGDLRKSRVHAIFRVPNDCAFDAVLCGEARFEDAVRPTAIERLSILPAGGAACDPTTLLQFNVLRAIFQQASEKFDVVLIDAPPMSYLPDARIMAQCGARVVVVVRAGQTSAAALTAACLRLEDDHADVLGIVLNDWDPTVSQSILYRAHRTYYLGLPSGTPPSADRTQTPSDDRSKVGR